MPHDGRARAGVSEPRVSEAHAADTGSSPPVPDAAASDRALTFAGVALAAVYVPGAGEEALQLVEAAGCATPECGLPVRLPLSGGSPAAHAFRIHRPLWLNPAALASYSECGLTPPRPEASLGALPLGTESRRLGCLVVVGASADGFEAEQRRFLERYAIAVADMLQAGAGRPTPSSLLTPALRSLRVGSFALVPDTGLIEADETLLKLVGITPDHFDGKVDTLLAHALPEDLPALMSVLDPSTQTFGRRELEFRVRRPTGEMRWLSLSCRVVVSTGDRPEQVLGMVTATSVLRRSADDVSRIQWLTAVLDDAATVPDVGRVVVTALREPLGADRVALAELQDDRLMVTVLDPPQPAAWPETWRSEWRSKWPNAPVGALPTLQMALRDGRLDLWPAGSALEPGLAGIGTGGLAVLPLPAKGRMTGVCLVGWDQPHEFVPEERSLLTATAALVGQALKRAHAHDAEQELATMLQRSLLPRRLPELPGGTAVARYLPARRGLQVGGDWYDVIALSEDRVALVIGDVQGHSAGAATIMGQMRTAVRAYAVEGHPPDVVVSHANRLLVGMETDLFATCCYAELDMDEGNILFVRAGHLSPLIRQPDGSTEEVEVEGGLPLGVSLEAEFPMTAVALAPGTVLALVTDGLVEAHDLPLDEGMRRTRTALAAADPADPELMADALLGDIGRREDDVALLLLRYDGMKTRPIRVGWVVWRLPDAVMHARRFTARTLRRWNVEEVGDAVLLVVSELVTNALVHTQGPVRLDLMLRGDRVRVSVSDSSPRAPAKPVIVDWESTGGRGLLLVEAMSESFGSVPVAGGKQVWSEIVVPQREPAPADSGLRTEHGGLR
ncbi:MULTISPECIES: SpoIIE family protein phosphatase [unclassified Streptomyces]|uniref:SpoIIE family protein phosphatase n=1 Tax=unclassified Streptomyces TaxID=2593676 RepID=UPI002E819ABB|nr:SpoIIE family protein phosphatase [Streptomyces sp. NBC_00589]WTI41253.1 SpoIIE family protein phosphatase [Streptomyces sp. NBC_00775]WUB25063.1 SpoIIE family protein phosphatase [Streptomyces sp. NBC_00589]